MEPFRSIHLQPARVEHEGCSLPFKPRSEACIGRCLLCPSQQFHHVQRDRMAFKCSGLQALPPVLTNELDAIELLALHLPLPEGQTA